jgi:hypothetical protein
MAWEEEAGRNREISAPSKIAVTVPIRVTKLMIVLFRRLIFDFLIP